jgi:hypothetical protein
MSVNLDSDNLDAKTVDTPDVVDNDGLPDGDGIDEGDEDQMFADLADSRAQGKSMRALANAANAEEAQASASDDDAEDDLPDDDTDVPADDEDKEPEEEETEEPKESEPPSKPKSILDHSDVDRFATILERDLDDVELEPADGVEPAVTVKSFKADYPALAKYITLVANAARKAALAEAAPAIRHYQQQYSREMRDKLLDQIDGSGPEQIADAKGMANSKEFAEWYKTQPDEVKALGRSSLPANAVKLLALFKSETGWGGGAADDSRTKRHLDTLMGTRSAGRSDVPLKKIYSPSVEIDEDEAERLYREAAANRRKR